GRLTEAEQRGQALYERGAGASGRPVTAVLGGSDTEVPASVVVCVNCHGHDGRGRPEGGIFPTGITSQGPTKPDGGGHGRRRPASTEALVKRSVALGLDSAGRPLHASMPRYRLGLEEADDLIAYLKKLGRLPEPGVSPTAVRVAALLPPPGAMERAVAA